MKPTWVQVRPGRRIGSFFPVQLNGRTFGGPGPLKRAETPRAARIGALVLVRIWVWMNPSRAVSTAVATLTECEGVARPKGREGPDRSGPSLRSSDRTAACGHRMALAASAIHSESRGPLS